MRSARTPGGHTDPDLCADGIADASGEMIADLAHSDYDQGGQKGPFWDLSQNIFSSIHSISPKFRERSGNGQTWLNPKFESPHLSRCRGCPMGVLGNRTAFHMIFDCQLSRGRARAPGCQRCFEAVLIRTAIRFSSTAAALPSHASSMHQDRPSEEVAALVRAHGTGRTCLYRSAVDARLAGRLHARAQGSSCGED